jgi:hypothetical protein
MAASSNKHQVYRDPCFLQAMLWGAACGVMLAANKQRSLKTIVQHGTVGGGRRKFLTSPLDHGFFGFTVSGSLAWFMCRYSKRARQQKLQGALDNMKEYQDKVTAGGR